MVHGDNVTIDTNLVEDKYKTGTGKVLRLGQQTKIKTKTALLKTQFCVVFRILICLPTSNLFNKKLWTGRHVEPPFKLLFETHAFMERTDTHTDAQ